MIKELFLQADTIYEKEAKLEENIVNPKEEAKYALAGTGFTHEETERKLNPGHTLDGCLKT